MTAPLRQPHPTSTPGPTSNPATSKPLSRAYRPRAHPPARHPAPTPPVAEPRRAATTRIATITKAEDKVLAELCKDGADNQTIGRRLGIATDTVKSHIRELLAETSTDNRTALAVAVLRRRIRIRIDPHARHHRRRATP